MTLTYTPITVICTGRKTLSFLPMQAVCRSVWPGSECEWASDQRGPAGVPGRDESSLQGHADWTIWHHERTGLIIETDFIFYFFLTDWPTDQKVQTWFFISLIDWLTIACSHSLFLIVISCILFCNTFSPWVSVFVIVILSSLLFQLFSLWSQLKKTVLACSRSSLSNSSFITISKTGMSYDQTHSFTCALMSATLLLGKAQTISHFSLSSNYFKWLKIFSCKKPNYWSWRHQTFQKGRPFNLPFPGMCCMGLQCVGIDGLAAPSLSS